MAFIRRQAVPVPEEETAVWACVSEDCPGWMRKDFSFDHHPVCPLCSSEMREEIRLLPELKN